MFRIGCHLSSAGGYLAMGQTAVSIGANVFQFFTRNPRGGAAKPIDKADAKAFMEYAAENGIGPILAHAPYTLNAAGQEDRGWLPIRRQMRSMFRALPSVAAFDCVWRVSG